MSGHSADIEIGAWLEATSEVLAEVAQASLGFEGCRVVGPREAQGPLTGAYIALVGQRNAVQLAVAATPEVCALLSAALLGMEEDEAATLGEADVIDGIGELINMVAGGVKTRLAERDPGLQLGLPVVIHGRVEVGAATTQRLFDAQLGPLPVVIVVIGDAKVAVEAAA